MACAQIDKKRSLRNFRENMNRKLVKFQWVKFFNKSSFLQKEVKVSNTRTFLMFVKVHEMDVSGIPWTFVLEIAFVQYD